MKFKKFEPKERGLHLFLMGAQGSGKTTTCGSLLREPTVLLYSTTVETHSPIWMAKAADELYTNGKPASSKNLLVVKIDEAEEGDDETFGFKNVKIGQKLTGDQSLLKINTTLSLLANEPDIKSVIIDSLNSLYPIIVDSLPYKSCVTKEGKPDPFRWAEVFKKELSKMVGLLSTLSEQGKNTVLTCLGKVTGLNTDLSATSISPEFPAFSVAESILPYFTDLAIMNPINRDGMRSVLDFGMRAGRKAKNIDGTLKKYLHIEPRLSYAPIGVPLDEVYPDLYYIKDIIKEIEKNYKESEQNDE